jgi:hypothetical protein
MFEASMDKLSFLEKLALERAEIMRLIRAANAAAVPSVGLPQDVNRKVQSLMREARIDEAQQVIVSYLEDQRQQFTQHPG